MLYLLAILCLFLPSPPPTSNSSDTASQLCPEPLPHQAVDVEVEAGVEDDEDVVEVSDTEPGGWYRVFTSTGTLFYPEWEESIH